MCFMMIQRSSMNVSVWVGAKGLTSLGGSPIRRIDEIVQKRENSYKVWIFGVLERFWGFWGGPGHTWSGRCHTWHRPPPGCCGPAHKRGRRMLALIAH